MKKFLCMILVLTMVFSMTACGKKNKTESTDTASGENENYDVFDYVTLGDYKGVKVNTYVSDEDIQSKIDELIKNNSFERVTDRVAADGDAVNIDFVGTIDGKEFDGGTYQGADLEIGTNSFIEGFETGIVGMKAGESKDLNLKFPDPYTNSPDLAGKDVVFAVTLNYIKGKETTPEFNDDFVNMVTNGEFKTVDSYKEKVSADILADNKDKMGDTAFSTVLENCKVSECPDFLVDKMTKRLTASYKSMAKSSGYDDFNKFLSESYGSTEDQFNTQIQSTAKSYVEQQLITEAIAEKEKIEVTDDEYKKQLNEYMMSNNISTEKDMESYVQTNFASSLKELMNETIILDKVLSLVKENAVEINEPVKDKDSTGADASLSGDKNADSAE